MTEFSKAQRKKMIVAETECSICWWREGAACYNNELLRVAGYNKMPREVDGDSRDGLPLTDELWGSCPKTAKYYEYYKNKYGDAL